MFNLQPRAGSGKKSHNQELLVYPPLQVSLFDAGLLIGENVCRTGGDLPARRNIVFPHGFPDSNGAGAPQPDEGNQAISFLLHVGGVF